MIPCWSINFLSSSALCTDALSHTSRRRLAGNSSGPVCWRLGLHQWPVMPAVHQRPVMPTGDAAGWLRVRLAFGHPQRHEPLALAYSAFA